MSDHDKTTEHDDRPILGRICRTDDSFGVVFQPADSADDVDAGDHTHDDDLDPIDALELVDDVSRRIDVLADQLKLRAAPTDDDPRAA